LGFIIVSGGPGIRTAEVARVARVMLSHSGIDCELIDEPRLSQLIHQEFPGQTLPEKAWGDAVTALLVHAALEHHLLVTAPSAEYLLPKAEFVLRVKLEATEPVRVGCLMLTHDEDRPSAKARLRLEMTAARELSAARFGRKPMARFDQVLNAATLTSDQMASMILHLAQTRGMSPLLTPEEEAQIQFDVRLGLAKHGIAPAGRAPLKRSIFANKSEEIFANLLDFYRIEWQYEPRSFPLAWDRANQPLEMFTPDFYLPEFDLYVELTTMKQSLVTRKNRKVKLLKQIYPEVNIQVFYQRDFQNLVFKHGLPAMVHV
jgi:hypothetical protein